MNFYSLSLYPGQTGKYYYSSMFERLGLQHTYTPLGCHNLKSLVERLKSENADGISISMPYKTEVIELLDYKDDIVEKFNSCNTIKIIEGKLHGYNTDYYGALYVLSLIDNYEKVTVLGDGAMGSMFINLLGDRAIVYSRKMNNWNHRHYAEGAIINCTSFGTVNGSSPFTVLPNASIVIDLAIKPGYLEQQCQEQLVEYIGGLEFYKRQFIKQFEIYTGVALDIKDLNGL